MRESHAPVLNHHGFAGSIEELLEQVEVLFSPAAVQLYAVPAKIECRRNIALVHRKRGILLWPHAIIAVPEL